MDKRTRYYLTCYTCGQEHEAEYSHQGRFGEGAIYAVVCPLDGLTDYYTREAAGFREARS